MFFRSSAVEDSGMATGSLLVTNFVQWRNSLPYPVSAQMYRHAKRFEDQHPDDFIVSPHELCKLCRSLCASSQLLRDVPGKYCETVLIAENEADPGLAAVTESHLHATISELESSYLNGCHLCSLIYERLPPDDVKLLRGLNDATINAPRIGILVTAREGPRECELRLEVIDEENDHYDTGVALKVFAANGEF